MDYKQKIRSLVRLYRCIGTNKFKMKSFVAINLGSWNQHIEQYYKKAVTNTQALDFYQKTNKYKKYKKNYFRKYQSENRTKRNEDAIRCIYKKKYGDKWEQMFQLYLQKRDALIDRKVLELV